jgi:hypothetical protein
MRSCVRGKNREQQEALENTRQIRDAALKEEEELARLKNEVEAFPARLQ